MAKEHPILFSGPLVRAILDGRKTQTRRLIRSRQPKPGFAWRECLCGEIDPTDRPCLTCSVRYEEPKYKVGDRLWVRETWQIVTGAKAGDLGAVVRYRDMELLPVAMPAEKPMPLGLTWDRWRPSIHMPRWASRISLEVTDVRAQRVQDIDEDDARAEGCEPADVMEPESCRSAFEALWDSLAPEGQKWADNPWVGAISFRRVQP